MTVAATANADASGIDLLSLPFEIRLRIYRLSLGSSVHVSLVLPDNGAARSRRQASNQSDESSTPPLGLLWDPRPNIIFVNKHIAAEALPEYYRNVSIGRVSTGTGQQHEAQLLQRLLKNRNFLRHARNISVFFNDWKEDFFPDIHDQFTDLRGVNIRYPPCNEPIGTPPGKAFEPSVLRQALRRATGFRMDAVIIPSEMRKDTASESERFAKQFDRLPHLQHVVLEFTYYYVDKLRAGSPGSTARKSRVSERPPAAIQSVIDDMYSPRKATIKLTGHGLSLNIS